MMIIRKDETYTYIIETAEPHMNNYSYFERSNI